MCLSGTTKIHKKKYQVLKKLKLHQYLSGISSVKFFQNHVINVISDSFKRNINKFLKNNKITLKKGRKVTFVIVNLSVHR